MNWTKLKPYSEACLGHEQTWINRLCSPPVFIFHPALSANFQSLYCCGAVNAVLHCDTEMGCADFIVQILCAEERGAKSNPECIVSTLHRHSNVERCFEWRELMNSAVLCYWTQKQHLHNNTFIMRQRNTRVHVIVCMVLFDSWREANVLTSI